MISGDDLEMHARSRHCCSIQNCQPAYIARFARVQMICLDLFGRLTHFSLRACLAAIQCLRCTHLQQAKTQTGTALHRTGNFAFYLYSFISSLCQSRCATRMGSPHTMLLYVQMNATTAIDRQITPYSPPEKFSPSLVLGGSTRLHLTDSNVTQQ